MKLKQGPQFWRGGGGAEHEWVSICNLGGSGACLPGKSFYCLKFESLKWLEIQWEHARCYLLVSCGLSRNRDRSFCTSISNYRECVRWVAHVESRARAPTCPESRLRDVRLFGPRFGWMTFFFSQFSWPKQFREEVCGTWGVSTVPDWEFTTLHKTPAPLKPVHVRLSTETTAVSVIRRSSFHAIPTRIFCASFVLGHWARPNRCFVSSWTELQSKPTQPSDEIKQTNDLYCNIHKRAPGRRRVETKRNSQHALCEAAIHHQNKWFYISCLALFVSIKRFLGSWQMFVRRDETTGVCLGLTRNSISQ